MRLTFTLLTLALAFQLQAQTSFTYSLFFEDSIGNRDTVIVGFDQNATHGIDSAFGEEDISNIPWDTSGLDVRVFVYGNAIVQETKKSIQNRFFFHTCYHTENQEIGVYTKHWPVTVSWDSTQFTGCAITYGISNAHLTFVKDGDPCSPYFDHQFYHWYSGKVFEKAAPMECTIQGITSPNAPDSTKILVTNWNFGGSIDEIAQSVNLYPNPANEKVLIELNTGAKPIDWVIYSITGQVVYSEQTRQSNPTLDVSGISNGTYILIGQSDDEVYRQKLMILKE